MSNFPIEIHAITSASDINQFFTLATQTFGPADADPHVSPDWQRLFINSPEYDLQQLRGTYRGGDLIAGCSYVERWMNLHGARVKVGCVGLVVTDPAFRKQGAARLLMEDLNALALAHACSFVLLHGFEFYLRWGYADVFDDVMITLDRASLLRLPPSNYSVRAAIEQDAPAWLRHFNQHYGEQPGGFERDEALQTHLIRWMRSRPSDSQRLTDQPPVVAVDADGNVGGYLQFSFAPLEVFGIEPAADTWPAALALLHHHAHLCETLPHPPQTLQWRVKPDSPLFYILADHVAINVATDIEPNHGWMARLANASAALNALLPIWSQRWGQATKRWRGVLALEIGDERFGLDLTRDAIHLTSAPATAHIHLTPQVFTQLAFGYRPARWAMEQPGQIISPEWLPLLEMLFPRAAVWVAPSDAF